MNQPIPNAVLVDKNNVHQLLPLLMEKMRVTPFVGIDIETQDSNRHEGINRLMAVDDEGFKSATKKLYFDTERTVVTGFSLYFEDDTEAYYFNLAHADIENRINFEIVRPLLESKPEDHYYIAHNSPFEFTMLLKSLKLDLGRKVICTLQLAVTLWNDDYYSLQEFLEAGLGKIPTLFPQVAREFAVYNPGEPLTSAQEELVGKVIAKESSAEHSYNGFVKSISWGFGLKGLTKRFLGYTQTTFEEVLGGRPHMGCLTGAEVVSYGADDAWVCVRLFRELMAWGAQNNPEAITTFFTQEAPMSRIYSKVWREGVRVDKDVIMKARDRERGNVAQILREMKGHVAALLPFPDEPHEKCVKYDSKFEKSVEKYREQVRQWVKTPDSQDVFTQVYQVRGPVSKAMAEERGKKESSGINLTYYQVMRVILYDLCGCSYIQSQGKTQSDSDARKLMLERWLKKHADVVKERRVQEGEDADNLDHAYEWLKDEPKVRAVIGILRAYTRLAASEQVTKLYITNYLNMIDPDTGRMYPQLTCMLATRRMALAQPNLSQLAKNSSIAYIRSCFLADADDEVIVSADWSSVELVIIGDESGDPEFAKAFGQIPYEDLHRLAAASVMDLTLEEFDKHPDKKRLRTDLGKGANFNYWYSGALGTIAGLMGWSSDEMWSRVEKYRERFAVAEKWRTDTILELQQLGYVTLRDGLRRYRFEATPTWVSYMRAKFEQYGPVIQRFGELCIKKIRNRAGNQGVNAKVQGTGATLMKRTVVKWHNEYEHQKLARFMFPVHDELVFSVKKHHVIEFIHNLRAVMNTHPDIIRTLRLNCSVAIGKNYLAWDKDKNPFGQVELDELQKGFPGFSEDRYGQKLTDDEIRKVVEYMGG